MEDSEKLRSITRSWIRHIRSEKDAIIVIEKLFPELEERRVKKMAKRLLWIALETTGRIK